MPIRYKLGGKTLPYKKKPKPSGSRKVKVKEAPEVKKVPVGGRP